jgi:hypothetical protein
MVGGLLNIITVGPEDIILIGNPTKSFFKRVYAKYTNFGLQRFRIDMEGQKEMQISESSTFKFNIPRYADLLMDTYFVITLPNIWSPIYATDDRSSCSKCRTGFNWTSQTFKNGQCTTVTTPNPVIHRQYAYEFKWIDSIGAQMIKNIRIMSDDQVLQEFTGQYLYSMVERDFSTDKKNLFNEMIGNVSELNDPANYSNRNGSYPNASYMGFTEDEMPHGLEPSIRGRQLYVPINIWSTLSSKMAIPLVSMQYSVLSIEVELRPIDELFVVRDIEKGLVEFPQINLYDCSVNVSHIYPEPYTHPDCTNDLYQLYLFLQEPPPASDTFHNTMGTIDPKSQKTRAHYYPKQSNWTADIHLVGTYVFLDDDEVRQFATNCQSYLIKDVHEQTRYNLIGQQYTPVQSIGLVSSWMWYFQRSDVNKRNQWSNYSNWPTLKSPLQATNNALYSLIIYLENVFRAAGSLTNLYKNKPNEFMLIWEIFIGLPLILKRSSIISPFHPPNFYGQPNTKNIRVVNFNKTVQDAGKNIKYSIESWYQSVGIGIHIPTSLELLAPIRSPWPLSTWAMTPHNPTAVSPPPAAGTYTETFNPNLISDWTHPAIAISDISAAFAPGPKPIPGQTPGYVGRAKSTCGILDNDYSNLIPIPIEGGFIPSGVPEEIFSSIPAHGIRNNLYTADYNSNADCTYPKGFNKNNKWLSTSAIPYCPLVCPSNNSMGAYAKACSTVVAPPIWTDYNSGCGPIINQAPDYWCEEFDASGSYTEINDKWQVALNILLAWQEVNDFPCGRTCPLTGLLGDVYITGEQTTDNIKDIMLDWGFNLDETVRETVLPAGIASYIDKYNRTAGNAKSGLYCYNFCLDTNPFVFQPSGAINMSRFNTVSWSYRVLEPVSQMADSVPVSITCDENGVPINDTVPSTSTAVNYWKNFKYSYNMHIMEERYNILVIENGVARLALSR